MISKKKLCLFTFVCLSLFHQLLAMNENFSEATYATSGLPDGWVQKWAGSSRVGLLSSQPQTPAGTDEAGLAINYYNATMSNLLYRTTKIEDEIVCDTFQAGVRFYARAESDKLDAFQIVVSTDPNFDGFYYVGDPILFNEVGRTSGEWIDITRTTTITGIKDSGSDVYVGILFLPGMRSHMNQYIKSLTLSVAAAAEPKNACLKRSGEIIENLIPGDEDFYMSVYVSPDPNDERLTLEGVYGVIDRNGDVYTNRLARVNGTDEYTNSVVTAALDAGETLKITAFTKYTSTLRTAGAAGADGYAYEWTANDANYVVGKLGSVWINELSSEKIEVCGTLNRNMSDGWSLVVKTQDGAEICSASLGEAFNFQTNIINGVVGLDVRELQWTGSFPNDSGTYIVSLCNSRSVAEHTVEMTFPSNHVMVMTGYAPWHESGYAYDWTGTAADGTFIWEPIAEASFGAINPGEGFNVPVSATIIAYTKVGEGDDASPLSYATIVPTGWNLSNATTMGIATNFTPVVSENGVATIEISGFSPVTNEIHVVLSGTAFGWSCEDSEVVLSDGSSKTTTLHFYPTVAIDDFMNLNGYWTNLDSVLKWDIATVTIDGDRQNVLRLNTFSATQGTGKLKCENYLSSNGRKHCSVGFDFRNTIDSYAANDEFCVMISTNSDFIGAVSTPAVSNKRSVYGNNYWYRYQAQFELPEGFSEAPEIWLQLLCVSQFRTHTYTYVDNLRIAFEDVVKPTSLAKTAEWPASGDETAFTLTVVPQTRDAVEDVSAQLYLVTGSVTNTVPFKFADGETAKTLSLVAVGEGDEVEMVAEPVEMYITGAELDDALQSMSMSDTEVTYFAAVRYNSGNGATTEDELYETRYFPDNHTTSEIDGVSYWIVEGEYGPGDNLDSFIAPMQAGFNNVAPTQRQLPFDDYNPFGSVSYSLDFLDPARSANATAEVEYKIGEGEWTAAGTIPVVFPDGETETAVDAIWAAWTAVGEVNGTYSCKLRVRVVDGDVSGRASGWAESDSFTLDFTKPTVTLASETPSPFNETKTFTVTATFSEAVTDFGADDITVENGSVASVEGSGNEYTITVTPSADGDVIVAVAEGGAVDAFGNGNAASAPLTRKYDNTAPTVTLTSDTPTPFNATKTFTVTATFSEDVLGFSAAGVTVANGTVASVNGSGSVYVITVTPTKNASISVTVNANAATDAAENGNTVSAELKRTYDNTKPTVTLASTTPDPFNSTKTFTVTATFSENVTGFAKSDITVANGTVATFSGSKKSYTFTVTPSGDGDVTVQVMAGVAIDAAENGNTASAVLTRKYDNTKPTVTLASTTPEPFNETKVFTVTATFSEDVTGFTAAGATVVNGTVSSVAGSGDVWTLTVTPSADGDVTVSVNADAASDAAENGNTASEPLTRKYDNTKPTVTLTSDTPTPFNSTKTFTVTATFSEDVTGFTAAGVTVANGTVSSVTGSGSVYTLTVTPSADGDVTVGVNADAAADAAENGNTASAVLTRKYDNTKPTVALASSTPNNFNSTKTFAVTATFSEDVTGFAAAGITVGNGTVANFSGSGKVYTFTVAPTKDGNVTVEVNADAATDAAENGNTASSKLTRKYDNTKPTVTLASTTPDPFNDTKTFTVTATFKESVTGFSAAGVTVGNGTVATFSGSGKSYTITVTPAADGDVTVSVNADAAVDAAQNGNTASAVLTRRYDTTKPTVTLSSETPDPFNDESEFSVVVAFSEPVNGFTAQSVTVGNGTVESVTPSENPEEASKVWTVVVEPQAQNDEKVFDVSVSVAAGAVADAAENGNTASETLTLQYDIEPPTVTLTSGTPALFNPSTTFTVTATFSEDVENLDASMITVDNGIVSSVTGSGDVWTLTVEPGGDGDVSVQIEADKVKDLAGNFNTASGTLTRKYDGTRPEISVMWCTTPNPFNATKTFSVDIQFSEPVIGFSANSVTVENGTVDVSGSGGDWTLKITPLADGNVSVSIAENAVTDAAGNGNIASSPLARKYDNTKPTVTLTSETPASFNSTKAFTVTATFSEVVTGFTAAGVTVANGTVAVSGSGSVYTLMVTPGADGDVTVSVNADAAVDAAENGNTASEPLTRKYDNTPPTVTLTSETPTPFNSAKTFTVTATFSEGVTGFAATGVTVVNGTVAVSGSGSVYTLTVTPSADGDVTVGVNGGAAADAAENGNAASEPLTRKYDNTKPTVTLTSETPNPFNETKTFTVTATFSEDVTGFAKGDVTVGNGTVKSVEGSGKVYTLTVTPSADGDVTVSVNADAAVDAAENGNTASAVLKRKYDNTKPTVTLASSTPTPFNSTKTFTVTATFSEEVTGFAAAGITVVNGTVATFSGSGKVYTFTVTPTKDGDVKVSVNADAASDAAENGNTASTVLTRKYDNTKPTVTLASTTPNPFNATKTFTVTATFSENVTGFAKGDITVGNGTVATFSGSGKSYTFTVTPSGDGEVTVKVNANKATDAAGNSNNASSTLTLRYDNTPPTVELTTETPESFNATKTFIVTATFSEDVTGFTAEEVAFVSEGAFTIASFTGSGSVYQIEVTPPDGEVDFDVSVSLAPGVATDAAENGNIASNALTLKYDNTRPEVTLTSETPENFNGTDTFTVTATFTEDVEEFDASAVTVVNGTVVVSGSGAVWTLTITPTEDGDVTVSFAENAVTDAAENGNVASEPLTRKYDNTAPTVTMTTETPNPFNATKTFTVTATFSEDVTGFSESGVTVVNGSVAFSGSGSVYTLMVTPAADGDVTVSVNANAAFDAAHNGNAASESLTRKYDNTKPTVTLTSDTPTPFNATKTFTVTATFSEPVTGFTEAGIKVTNGTVATFSGSGSVYTFTVTPNKNASISVQVLADKARDAAENGNTASTALSRTYDNTKPTVTLASTTPNPFNATKTFTVTATFSENVTGFAKGDITVGNGTVATFSGSKKSYTFTVTPSGDGDVTVQVNASKATDAAGNGNTASDLLTRSYDSTPATVTLSSTTPDPFNATKDFIVTATFSEDVTGFTAVGIAVVNGAVAAFTGSGSVYTFTVTPNAEDDITVQVNAGAALDAAENGNTASAPLTRKYDNTAPTVTLTSETPDPFNDESTFSVVVAFSEPALGFTDGSLTVVNGEVESVTPSENPEEANMVWTVVIEPQAQGNENVFDVSVSVAADVVADDAENRNAASETLTRTYDVGEPTVTLATDTPQDFNTDSFTVTVTFSEEVVDFGASSLTVVNGNAATPELVEGEDSVYTVVITPDEEGEVTVQLEAAKVADLAGNFNTESNTLTRNYDVTNPGVMLATDTPNPFNADTPFVVTATFDEEVVGFDATKVTVVNGSVASAVRKEGEGCVWTLTINPTADGDVKVSIAANKVTDAAGNGNNKTNKTLTRKYDNTKPTVTLTSSVTGWFNAETTFIVTATFSEPVTGFAESDITVTNGNVKQGTLAGSGSVYTFTVTPTADGPVTVQVKADAASDAARNGNEASGQIKGYYDNTPPQNLKIEGNPENLTTTKSKKYTLTASANDISEITYAWQIMEGGVWKNLAQTQTITGDSVVGENKVRVFAIDQAHNQPDSVVYTWTYEPSESSGVDFGGGVSVPVDEATGEPGSVEFVSLDFKAGKDSTFVISGFSSEESAIDDLELWFVVRYTLTGDNVYIPAKPDATFEEGKLTVTLDKEKTAGHSSFYIFGITNSATGE